MSDNSIQKRCSFRTRAKARYRRTSRDLTVGGESTTEMGKPKTDGVTKERKGKRERWLLTRKTWRYMADAGRKLIPEGALNRPDDVPKIEAYFQEVCHREPRFLLWRKQSYPGALGFRARGRSRGGRRKIGGSCRDKTSSADEADDLRQQQERESQSSSQDSPYKKIIRPSLLQLKQEFLFGRKESPPETTPTKDALVENVLCHFDDGTSSKALDHQELLDRLTAHLASIELKESQQSRSDSYSVDTTQKQLIETMRRYYSKSTNRDKVISDILTDRKLLHKMYFELRRARGFSLGSQGGSTSRGGGSTFDSSDGGGILKPRSRTGMGTDSSGAGPSGWSSSGAFRRVFNPSMSNFPGSTWKYSDFDEGDEENDEASPWSSPPQSDTPLSGDLDYGTQTDPITEQMMGSIDEEMRRQEEVQKAAIAAQQKEVQKAGGSGGRRSSLNHDDVSQSVSDTIKRYLKMARKKSTDSDKADRFKRINYDQTLRDIKAKPEDPISKDEDQDKGIQTDLSWVSAIKTLKLPYVPVEDTPPEVSSPPPATKSLLSSGQMFLSNLLHGLQHSSSSCSVVAAAAGSMQKSKSSSSVVQQGTRLVARKVWKGRSKSQTRATPAATSTWTPQGNCVWTNVTGRSVTVEDTPLLQLTDVERRLLQKVALAKLQALNLGVAIRTPSEAVSSTVQKPKRRAHLLKRKAITTGFFDTNRKDQEKKGDGSGGLVFGIPLGQCVENERAVRLRSGSHEEPVTQLRRESHHGSRTSFTSLIETPRCADERGSCESLISPTLSMPGLLDSLSTPDLSASSGVDGTVGPGVPNIVATCLSHLETHGLHTLGLFRVSSSKKRVRQLREDFDSGKESTLDAESCPHDVATLLKEYFRDLPDSLLCKDLYPAFIQTQRIRNRRLQQEALRNLIYLLPVANRDTLWALLNLLSLVASNAEDHQSSDGEWRLGNKMDSNNLATLFAPNILHSSSSNKSLKDEMSAERVEERADAINVVRSLIDNCKQLYVVSAEMMDEVYNHLMDSAPEVLDTLLRRRDLQADETVDEQEVSMMSEDLSERLATTQDEQQATCAEEMRGGGGKERRMWSRGAFTHETAGMGGPDSEVKPRYKGRSSRERISKKRREDIGGGRRSDYDTGSNTPSRRSSAQGVDEYSSEQINSSRSSLESGAITAVLKIPVPASASAATSASFAVNLDDSDIPYIEDSSAAAVGDRQHISLSMVRTSGASSGQQRTRSQSGGSDSSTTTTTYHVHHHYHHQTAAPHSDSAIGTHSSSAAPSSHSGVYSSPPSSWASSTPPTSPTSPTTPYQYDDEPTTARISIPTKKDTSRTTPDTRQVILQRVTVKSTGELQHVKSSYIQPSSTQQLYLQTTPQVYVQPSTPSPQVHPTTPQLYNPQSSPQPAPRRRSGGTFQRLLSSSSTGSVSKSVSSSAIGGSGGVERIIPILKEGSQSPTTVVPDRKITTSISSIGGAVMRSKTADIERMIKVSSSAQSKQQPAVVVKKSAVSDKEDDKRKRRYTDVRHQTRHIPTDLAAEGGSSGGGAVGEQRRTVVWKRGQIISSEPKERRGFL